MLELAYYCLITGFEGEQHLRTDGRQTLDNLIEELYQLIQQHRVDKPSRLFKAQEHVAREPQNYKPLIFATLIAVGVLAAGFIVSHTLLEHKAKTLLLGYTPQHG